MSHFDFDRAWISEELYRSPELADMVSEAGEQVLNEAVRLAGQSALTGDFQRSIKGALIRGKNNAPFFRVWSDDPAALTIEFGAAKASKPPHRVLGRAIGRWHDVNTARHPASSGKRKAHVEKHIDAWVAAVVKRGR